MYLYHCKLYSLQNIFFWKVGDYAYIYDIQKISKKKNDNEIEYQTEKWSQKMNTYVYMIVYILIHDF